MAARDTSESDAESSRISGGFDHIAVQPLLAETQRAYIYMCPYETAVAHLSRGDEAGRARATDLLFEAASLRSNCLILLRLDPRMRVLCEDARLAGRLGRCCGSPRLSLAE